ncbi:MAG: hypothetical protein HYY23_02455 [Verrucomicrobia bacterium]|nr:hypothetical protein [Verrucomicrobiota bacterium]
MGLQALQLYQRVAKRFGPEHRFQLDLWKFEALGVPSLGRHAADEAAAADLLIIAANRDDRVPLDLRIWIEQWTDRKIGKECVLVFLSERSSATTDGVAPMHAFLRDVARQNLMTFLSDSLGTIGRVRNAFMEQIQERARQSCFVREKAPLMNRSILAFH